MNQDPLLEGLNGPQRDAVLHIDGPMIVLAGPGSGKTRVVTHRIAHLIRSGIRPWNIVALTFTNKAADEMKARLQRLVPDQKVWIGTFHKFCAFLLRTHAEEAGFSQNFTIYDTDESLALLKQIAAQHKLPSGVNVQSIQWAISTAKNNMQSPDQFAITRSKNELGKTAAEIYTLYQKELQRANAVDFDDLLMHVALLLQKNDAIRAKLDDRYRYVLVDEYQDTNLVQYAIARALCRDFPNLAVTGDPDQSIYGWRGANIRNILDFEKDYNSVKTIKLEQNYRSTRRILEAADALIHCNSQRKKKSLFTENEKGERIRLVVCSDQHEEADVIAQEIAREIKEKKYAPKDYAIFYRVNALSRNLEHAMRKYRVPFQLIRGLEFYERKEVKDVIAYLQLIYNPSDTISFHRTVNEPKRGIGRSTLEKIADYASQRGIATLDAARDLAQSPEREILPKAKTALRSFVALIDSLSEMAAEELPVSGLIEAVLQKSQYLKQYDSNSEEDMQRAANVKELVTAAREFDKMDYIGENSLLGAFLEQTALVSDIDSMETNADRVSLMTLHAAKGLEFPVVYMIGIEEGILPHERSTYKPEQIEEERRLCFVGVTRAEAELRLSVANYREFYANFGSTISSRFLMEMPKHDFWIVDVPGNISNAIQSGEEFCRDYSQADPEYDEFEEEPKKKPKKEPMKLSIMTAAQLKTRK